MGNETNCDELEPETSEIEFRGTKHWRPMSLDTLSPRDDARINKKVLSNRNPQGPCTLSTEGIESARPLSLYKHTNRGLYADLTLSKKWEDLEKSKPHTLIPVTVNKPFTNLTIEDIQGAHPNPKNMKLGNAARNTNPLDPEYVLPSYEPPPAYEPKFSHDSMDLADIPGAHPQRLIKLSERNQMNMVDIDGTSPGWKPAHRKRFGKTPRDLCLKVQDINIPVQRMIRDPQSQAYIDIEGTHPKFLTHSRNDGCLQDTSLHTEDIEGAKACSATLKFHVLQRKEHGKVRNEFYKEQEHAKHATNLLKSKVQDQIRHKTTKEIGDCFKQLDRQFSGKLTPAEVHQAFKHLEVDLNSSDLHLLSTAFDTTCDGFVDYRKMLNQLVPAYESKRWNPDKFNSRCISLCMNQWIDPAYNGSESSRAGYREIGSARNRDNSEVWVEATKKELNTLDDGLTHYHTQNQGECCKESQAINCCKTRVNDGDNTGLSPRKQMISSPQQLSPPKKGSSDYNSALLPSGGSFWPEEKSLHIQQNPKIHLSLVQDSREHLQKHEQPLSETEKRWTKKVGGTLFTGEGQQVCSESHMHGLDWAKPSTPQCLSACNLKYGKPQDLLNLNLKQQLGCIRSPRSMKTTPRDYLHIKSPVIGGTGVQNILRPKTASHSSRPAAWPPTGRVTSSKDGICTSRRDVGIHCNKNRVPQKHVSQMKEDVAAVRALA